MQMYDGTEGWGHRSRLLALALQVMEDETGQEGHPIADELDPDMNGWYEAEVLTNEAVAARQRHAKNYKPQPGEFVVIRDTRPTDDN